MKTQEIIIQAKAYAESIGNKDGLYVDVLNFGMMKKNKLNKQDYETS